MRFKKVKRTVSLLLAIMLSLSIVFSLAVAVSAEEDSSSAAQDVEGVKDSVLLLRMTYSPGGKYDDIYLERGSCFLINDDTILTCQHEVIVTSTVKSLIKAYYVAEGDVNFSFDDAKIGYDVVLNGGVHVSATLKKTSDTDFAILKLNEPVNRGRVALGDSEKVETTQAVYAVGFPSIVKDLNDSKKQTKNSITVTNGTISNHSTISGVEYIQHTATISDGNSGGPLVDENGVVVGINNISIDKTSSNYYYAVGINEVIAALKDLGIEYTPAPGTTETTDTKAEESEETEETKLAPTEPATDLNDTTSDSGFGMTQIIIIIAIAVLVIVLAVVIILIVVNNKKKKNAPKPPTGQMTPPRPMTPPQPRPMAQPQPNNFSDEGAGETSVLNDGAGETTVLNGQTGGVLLRKSNGDRINLNKAVFNIGKERRRVDYCISDNSSVSRVHAKISAKAGKYYITDLNSTNCTFVNGSKLTPNQEVALNPGDKIKISDEEFEFLG